MVQVHQGSSRLKKNVHRKLPRDPSRCGAFLGLFALLVYTSLANYDRTYFGFAYSTNKNATMTVRSPLDGQWKAVPTKRNSASGLKHILYWNTYWGKRDYDFGEGQEPFVIAGCPVDQCFVTKNRDHLAEQSDFDAVLFHGHFDQLFEEDLWNIRQWRQPRQRFVLLAMESASLGANILHSLPNERLNGFFNWTMSYRWDSDFPRPYGWFQEKSSRDFYPMIPDKWKEFDRDAFRASLPTRAPSFRALYDRPKMAAWIVSNCNSYTRREDYVARLKRYIPVDIFGRCGDIRCDEKYDSFEADNCTQTVTRDYKFYLSFENSFCDDYVTEKFFGRVSDHVVVVLGQANYSRMAPPHSHLNVLDYESPKALADHMKKVASGRNEYLSYFWWKEHYDVVPAGLSKTTRNMAFARSMCDLCARLHKATATEEQQCDDLHGWWREQAHCDRVKPKLVRQLNLMGFS